MVFLFRDCFFRYSRRADASPMYCRCEGSSRPKNYRINVLTSPLPPVLKSRTCATMKKVGKSSTCLGLMGALLRREDLCSSDLAYIKPATQCEKPQLVTDWCEANGVACRGIGPVVFYKVRNSTLPKRQ